MEVSDADRETVERIRELLGIDTDFDEYTFSIKRGSLRTILKALSTQASELDALRGEVERLTLDGIHTCSDACQRPACVLRRENAQLRDRVAGLEHIASDLLQHIDWLTCGLPKMLEDAALTDEEGLIGAAVDAANSARALLTQNEVG